MAKALYVDGNYILVMDREEVQVVYALLNYSSLLKREGGVGIEKHTESPWRELDNLRNGTKAGFTYLRLEVKP